MTLRKLDGYVLDCIDSEEVSLASEVTAYPVESGGEVVDHVRNLATVVTLTLTVSDTPVGEVARQRSADAIPSSEARDFLRRLRLERRPFTFEGTTGTYDRMVFEDLTEPRDGQTGDALVIEATLRQIEVAEVRREVVRAVNLGHRPSRTAKGPTMCICPDVSGSAFDDRANKAKKCREVHEKNGRMYYVDTGQEVGLGDRLRAKPCPNGETSV